MKDIVVLLKEVYMSTYVTEEQAYDSFGKAVAAQAVEDYKRALKHLWALEKQMHLAKKTIDECERFFDSGYGFALSDLNGDCIKKNATARAKYEFDHVEIVTAHVKTKLRKKKVND